MKKKSPRGVPDFARKTTRRDDATRPDATPSANAKATARGTPAAARVKPQATSSKSGQRGK